MSRAEKYCSTKTLVVVVKALFRLKNRLYMKNGCFLLFIFFSIIPIYMSELFLLFLTKSLKNITEGIFEALNEYFTISVLHFTLQYFEWITYHRPKSAKYNKVSTSALFTCKYHDYLVLKKSTKVLSCFR